jgi:hypothetical protein
VETPSNESIGTPAVFSMWKFSLSPAKLHSCTQRHEILGSNPLHAHL